jgi:hypothetical protein
VLTVEEGIREVDEYHVSRTKVRLDILCFGTKKRVKKIEAKLNHCLLHWVQGLGVDLALELWFSSVKRKPLDSDSLNHRLALVVECFHTHLTDDQKRGMHVQGHRLAHSHERLFAQVKWSITSILSHPMIASILSAVRSFSEK